MPRHKLAKASNIQYNSLHIHKSNVKLPELDVFSHRDRPIMLIFYLLCYAALLIKFTYYAQNYAQE